MLSILEHWGAPPVRAGPGPGRGRAGPGRGRAGPGQNGKCQFFTFSIFGVKNKMSFFEAKYVIWKHLDFIRLKHFAKVAS